MKFTPILTFITLAAFATATPNSLLRRTGEAECHQNNGISACCKPEVVQQPAGEALQLLKDPSIPNLIAVILSIIPFIKPTVGVALQCTTVGIINPLTGQLCKSPNQCCLAPQTGNSPANTGGLINALNSNSIVVCPQIVAA